MAALSVNAACAGLFIPQEREVREVERPIADIIQILEGPGNAATSAENNDRFRVLSNNINVLENRAKARRRALLMVSFSGRVCTKNCVELSIAVRGVVFCLNEVSISTRPVWRLLVPRVRHSIKKKRRLVVLYCMYRGRALFVATDSRATVARESDRKLLGLG